MGVKNIVLSAFSLSLLCSTVSASFFFGEACNERNTAYLYKKSFKIPANYTKCVDISASTNVILRKQSSLLMSRFVGNVQNADTLYADHMNLTRLPKLLMHSLPKLNLADFSSNKVQRVPFLMDRVSPVLSTLLLKENIINIPRKRPLFVSLSIKTLMLTSNGITDIYSITFSKMPNLKVLYLDENNLKHVSPDMFAPVGSNLLYLHLGGNYISHFPPKELMPKFLRVYITEKQREVTKALTGTEESSDRPIK